MRIRTQPRNRESRPRSDTPVRPKQEEINQAKMANLPSWRKKVIRLADSTKKEIVRRQEFFIKKGWLKPGEAL